MNREPVLALHEALFSTVPVTCSEKGWQIHARSISEVRGQAAASLILNSNSKFFEKGYLTGCYGGGGEGRPSRCCTARPTTLTSTPPHRTRTLWPNRLLCALVLLHVQNFAHALSLTGLGQRGFEKVPSKSHSE